MNQKSRVQVEFDIKIGKNGRNQRLILPEGYSTNEADVIKYIEKYLDIINDFRDLGESKRTFDGIREFRRVDVATPGKALIRVIDTPLAQLGAFEANHQILKRHLAEVIDGLDAHFSEPIHDDDRRERINNALQKVFEANKAIDQAFEGL